MGESRNAAMAQIARGSRTPRPEESGYACHRRPCRRAGSRIGTDGPRSGWVLRRSLEGRVADEPERPPDRFVLAYGDGPEMAEVSNVEELDALLDRITGEARADQCPCGVHIRTEAEWDGPRMSLGIGRDFSYLTFMTWHVDGYLDPGKPTEWWCGNDRGEIPSHRGIPVQTAREAAREFVRTGDLPTNVAWADNEASP